jgi:hypothetical protein
MKYLPNFIDRYLRTSSVIGGPDGTAGSKYRNPIVPNTWFADGQNGSDSNTGLDPRKPLKTILEVLTRVQSGDTVYLTGNFAEEAGNTPKNVEDVTFIGVGGRPRHADAARDAKANQFGFTDQNSGASWRPPATESGTTPLITVVHQGWTFENILFVAPTDAAAIKLDHSVVSGADDGGGSHLTVRNCRFADGSIGIEDEDGHFNVLVEDCTFQDLGDGIKNTSTSNAIPLMWRVRNCWFNGNDNHIRVSASRWLIHDNYFGPIGSGVGITLNYVSSQGASNVVTKNYLSGDYDGEYLGGTGDEWAGNFSMDTASAEVGAEGLTTAAPVA